MKRANVGDGGLGFATWAVMLFGRMSIEEAAPTSPRIRLNMSWQHRIKPALVLRCELHPELCSSSFVLSVVIVIKDPASRGCFA